MRRMRATTLSLSVLAAILKQIAKAGGSSEASLDDDYFSDDVGDAEWRQTKRAMQQKDALTDAAAAADDYVVELVKPKRQVGIAGFAVKKADAPDKYDRIMQVNAAADAAKRASMPTKEQVAEQKLQRRRAQQNQRQAKCRLKVKLAKSTKEATPKKRVHIKLGAANQVPELSAGAGKQPKRIKWAAYGSKSNQQAHGAGKGAGEGEGEDAGTSRKRGRPKGAKMQCRKARQCNKQPNPNPGKTVRTTG
jgi:hypothetical protein